MGEQIQMGLDSLKSWFKNNKMGLSTSNAKYFCEVKKSIFFSRFSRSGNAKLSKMWELTGVLTWTNIRILNMAAKRIVSFIF